MVGGKDALYDAKTDTIYVSGQSTSSETTTSGNATAAARAAQVSGGATPAPTPALSGNATAAPTPAPTSDGTAAPTPSTAPTADSTGGGTVVAMSGASVKDALIKVKARVAAGQLTVVQTKTIELALADLKTKTAATASRLMVVVNSKNGRVLLKWTTAGGISGSSATAIDSAGSAADSAAGSAAGSSQSADAGATDTSSGASDEAFRQEALAALKAPSTKVVGHVTADGRDALKIVVSPSVTYLVDPQTYDPIEWITRGDDGGVVLRFAAYELLQSTADNLDLLSLTAQHPGAKLDTDPQDYDSAIGRLFPKG